MARILGFPGMFGHALLFLTTVSAWTNEELVNLPGHLKEFGFSENVESVEEFTEFPYTRTFFEEYVHKSKPVLMKKAAMLSQAFASWSDEYFLQLEEPADSTVLVETKKKENRSQPAVDMSFKDFVKIYNSTDQYMVNTIPTMIASDVILPGPLQCEQIEQNILVDSVMWFSSGGTKSVVHTDSVDNINCLFRGEKKLIMVDPEKYAEKVDLDHPEGAYSDIDVDRVDFLKYPGLADVKYIHVDMKPGDCLYIPYKWIHQVRSYGSNIAVNIWWDFHMGLEVDLDQCPDDFDPDLTMDKVEMIGFGEMSMSKGALKDHFLDYTKRGAVDFQGFLNILLGSESHLDKMDAGKGYQGPVKKVFEVFDQNADKLVTTDEINSVLDEDWEAVEDYMVAFDTLVGTLEEKYAELHGEPVEYFDDDGDDATPHGKEEL